MAISNYISYAISLIETFLLRNGSFSQLQTFNFSTPICFQSVTLHMRVNLKSGLVWGFSFLQYCWEDELIFYYEKCEGEAGYDCFAKCKEESDATGKFNTTSYDSSQFYLDCVAEACYLKMIGDPPRSS